jgi:hypothetical protein
MTGAWQRFPAGDRLGAFGRVLRRAGRRWRVQIWEPTLDADPVALGKPMGVLPRAMRRLRLAVRTRTLLATVGVCAVLIWRLMSIPFQMTLWVGKRRPVYVSFLVVDRESGAPIPHAVVRCLDWDIPERGVIYAATTDELGRASVIEERMVHGWSSLFGEGQSISYPSWGSWVNCDGYQPAEVITLWDCIGRGGDPTRGGLHPPVIAIRLERLKSLGR